MPGEEAYDNSLAEGFAALQKSRLQKAKIIYGDQPLAYDPPTWTSVCDSPMDGRKALLSCALEHGHPRGSWHDTASGCVWEYVQDILWKPMPCSVHRGAMHAHLESQYWIQESSPRSSAAKPTISGRTAPKPSETPARPGMQRRRNNLMDVCPSENPRPYTGEPPVEVWEEPEQYILSNCQTDGWDKHISSHPHSPDEAAVDWQLERQQVNKAWCPTHRKVESFLTSRYGRMMPCRQTFDDSRRSMEPLGCSQEEAESRHPITVTPVTQTPGEFRLSSTVIQPAKPIFLASCDGDGPLPDFPWYDPGRTSIGWIPDSVFELGSSWCAKHEKNETGTRRGYLPVTIDRTTQRAYRPYIDDPNEVRKQPLFPESPTWVYGASDAAVTTEQPPSAPQTGTQELTHRSETPHNQQFVFNAGTEH
jgi:hypothetical protein